MSSAAQQAARYVHMASVPGSGSVAGSVLAGAPPGASASGYVIVGGEGGALRTADQAGAARQQQPQAREQELYLPPTQQQQQQQQQQARRGDADQRGLWYAACLWAQVVAVALQQVCRVGEVFDSRGPVAVYEFANEQWKLHARGDVGFARTRSGMFLIVQHSESKLVEYRVALTSQFPVTLAADGSVQWVDPESRLSLACMFSDTNVGSGLVMRINSVRDCEVKLRDASGRLFWHHVSDYASPTYCEKSVKWSRLRTELISLQLADSDQVIADVHRALRLQDEWVTLDAFASWLAWFGPLEAAAGKTHAVLSQSWFEPGIASREEAERAVRSKVASGQSPFLVRFSASERGCFALSFVDDAQGPDVVAHVLITVSSASWRVVMQCDNGERLEFGDLLQLIASQYGAQYVTTPGSARRVPASSSSAGVGPSGAAASAWGGDGLTSASLAGPSAAPAGSATTQASAYAMYSTVVPMSNAPPAAAAASSSTAAVGGGVGGGSGSGAAVVGSRAWLEDRDRARERYCAIPAQSAAQLALTHGSTPTSVTPMRYRVAMVRFVEGAWASDADGYLMVEARSPASRRLHAAVVAESGVSTACYISAESAPRKTGDAVCYSNCALTFAVPAEACQFWIEVITCVFPDADEQTTALWTAMGHSADAEVPIGDFKRSLEQFIPQMSSYSPWLELALGSIVMLAPLIMIVRLFGPLHRFAHRFAPFCNAPWFHWSISRVQADQRLSVQGAASFLVRFSSIPGSFALSYRSSAPGAGVQHALVEVIWDADDPQLCLNTGADGPRLTYRSFDELIAQERPLLGAPCPGAPQLASGVK